MFKALTIAGSDTSSGAGIQADLKTFSALGVYGTSVITALTAQNTRKVIKIEEVKPPMVKAQINAVLGDIKIDAVKVGMVYSKGIIDAVASTLKNVRVTIVLDPIFKAGTGATLLRSDAYSSFVKRLIPLASVITPNLMEAEKLASIRIKNIDDAKIATKKIAKLGAKSVIIKGGHMQDRFVIDLLYHKGEFFEFRGERIEIRRLHGAGCMFSAALAAEMAKGRNIVDATKFANDFVRRTIMNARKIGKGLSIASLEQKHNANALLADLQDAVDRLESIDGLGVIIPESQSNIVFARADAQSINNIAGVRGRMIKLNGNVKAASSVDFGASKHVASALLAMMLHDRSIRSAMNIKYNERLVAICEELGLTVSSYDRKSEPQEIKAKEGMSVKWGIEKAIAKINAIPDIVYHQGDWGKEPMILVFGKEPKDVVRKIIAILNKYSKS
ncbi:MAG TPA: bifunctional hydroxymethylpyrimidine kinase/phosphomethylpyrimidine kinase [Nitrososphaerales archaeon]|nr:bifunctional hydroxymethylpyrimidine kinase/phosphomethylpyrimidine kinase [Nitrososphaerales archaeon]